ncbi:MAG: FolB domain-containing protein [Chlamydiales bacterium]|jgi:FolB domain-containing protein
MKGVIKILNHKISCIIGVLPEEKSREQEIFVDLELIRDFSKCVRSDDVQDTICYVAVSKLCTETAQKGKFGLLETYCHVVLEELFQKYDLEWAKITVKKPDALPTGDYAVVELEKSLEKVGR